MRQDTVTVVIVTFNSAAVLEDCLNSIPRTQKLIVLDNASRDRTVELVRHLRPDAEIIVEPINRGFGSAANIGLGSVTSEFGLLLNADVKLGPDMIDRLADAATLYPRAGMMAPTSTENGKTFFGRTVFFNRRKKLRSTLETLPDGDICADYVGGSAMFFRMSAFSYIGGFDDRLFLFYEDDDLCLRMKRAGYELIQIHAARLDHLSGKSTSEIKDLGYWKEFHMAWSRMYVEKKHRGRLAALSYFLREGTNCAVKYLGRPTDKRRTRYAARIQGLWAFAIGRNAKDIGLGNANAPTVSGTLL